MTYNIIYTFLTLQICDTCCETKNTAQKHAATYVPSTNITRKNIA